MNLRRRHVGQRIRLRNVSEDHGASGNDALRRSQSKVLGCLRCQGMVCSLAVVLPLVHTTHTPARKAESDLHEAKHGGHCDLCATNICHRPVQPTDVAHSLAE